MTEQDKIIQELRGENARLKAEERKGKWLIHGEPPWYVVECSECGEKWHHWSGDKLLNYCGNCGADMREKE